MKSKKGGIKKYCEKHKIEIPDLAKYVRVSHSQLYLFDAKPFYPTRLETLQRIYDRTKAKYKVGLHAKDFLDWDILHKK